jgi:hypothetical protein
VAIENFNEASSGKEKVGALEEQIFIDEPLQT